jgi:LuxR family maltose regulon positive regulatory protein
VIRTKLHRPLVATDLVCRQVLDDRLEEGRYLPLTLVSAPAGYGKTTLISHWVGSGNGLSAWLSLDKTDNDPRTFVSYLVAAVQTIFPEACRETLDRLEADVPFSMAEISAYLVNDLDDVENAFVLVLDDNFDPNATFSI